MAAGLAWTREWPLLRLFLPGAVRKCPARARRPGAVTAVGGSLPACGASRFPSRAPDRAASAPGRRGTCAYLTGAGAPRMCCGSMCFGGRCTPRSCGWAVVGAELGWHPARSPVPPFSLPAERGVFRPGGRGQRRGFTSAGCVTGWPKKSRQARSPAAMAGCCVRDKEGQDGAGHGEVVQR